MARVKVSDYIAEFLRSKGIEYVFGLQGGAVVHLFDSIERTPGIETVFTHHEQSAALAAVAYSRVTENIGACIVTTGPGATNAITGLLGGWQDSIPCLFISGQTRKEHTSYGLKVRSVGTQELNIVDIVRPLTKYAKFIHSLDGLEDELERAYQISISGRPGPVWIDIPVNLQWEMFEPKPATVRLDGNRNGAPDFSAVARALAGAKKPIVLAGHGIRSGKAVEKFRSFVRRLGVPFATSWTAADLLPTDHPLNTGIVGISGQRGANKAVHNADLLLVLGGHLAIPQTSTLFDQFAPEAKKIVIDIDSDQLENMTIKVDLPIAADVNDFFDWTESAGMRVELTPQWLEDCRSYKEMNCIPTALQKNPRQWPRGVNSYVFNDLLTRALPDDACLVIDGGGTALYTGFQSSHLRGSQRIVCTATMSSMGTGLAESLGACLANGRKLTTCMVGDGSFLMNVQELQTIFHHGLPIKIFVMNNNGYLAIRHTQAVFLEGRYAGTAASGGISFPDIGKVAAAFCIPFFKVANAAEAAGVIDEVLASDGPAICEVVVPEDQDPIFKQGFKRNDNGTFSPMALGEMWPYTDS